MFDKSYYLIIKINLIHLNVSKYTYINYYFFVFNFEIYNGNVGDIVNRNIRNTNFVAACSIMK